MAWKGEINPSWLENQLPDSADEQATLYHLVDFFLLQSPCRFQSHRRRSIEVEWGIGEKLSDRSMKAYLDSVVFNGDANILIKDKLSNLEGLAKANDLEDDFYQCPDREIAIYTQASYKGNSNTYMSLFYHIRNSIAHGRFAFVTRSDGAKAFIFEDGSFAKKQTVFNLTARGIIKISSLVSIVDTVLNNPPERVDIDQLILDELGEGPKTKKEIIVPHEIGENGWKAAVARLKKDRRIIYRDNKWRLVENQTI